MDYFSSDWHLGHKNIIKFDNRPFSTIDEMDKKIIDNYNSIITNKDRFFFLGDFSFNRKKTEEYLSSLSGDKYFIKDNHDHRDTIKLYQKYGTYLGELAEVETNGMKIVLCHYALRVWNKSHRGIWHLYGHSHHSLYDDPNSLSFDVGINGNDYNYKPVSFDQVEEIIKRKEYKSVDHHN